MKRIGKGFVQGEILIVLLILKGSCDPNLQLWVEIKLSAKFPFLAKNSIDLAWRQRTSYNLPSLEPTNMWLM